MVGDDPNLGLWDPSLAIPMEWSAGHVWKVQLVRIANNYNHKYSIETYCFILIKLIDNFSL